MSLRYYGLMVGLAASFSFALAGCDSGRPVESSANPTTGAVAPKQVASTSDPLGTDQTLWTFLGFAKRQPLQDVGPHTGPTVSPVLWEAALDTFRFAGVTAQDSNTGLIVTKWYSPPGKPDERLRVSVFILSRALRSDSLTLTIDRQVRGPDGAWQATPVAQEVADGLDSAILQRARQIHAERYRNTMYN